MSKNTVRGRAPNLGLPKAGLLETRSSTLALPNLGWPSLRLFDLDFPIKLLAIAIAVACSALIPDAKGQEAPVTATPSPAPAIEAPFKQWYQADYTVREGDLVDVVQRVEYLIGSQSMVQALGQQRINVNEHFYDLEIVEAATLKADGRRIDVTPDKIIEQTGNPGQQIIFEADNKVRTVVFPDLAVGDRTRTVTRFRQKRAHSPGGFSYGLVFAQSSRIVSGRVSFDVPKDMQLHLFTDRLAHTSDTAGERTRHVWTYDERPYKAEEASAVLPFDREPRLIISSFRDWEAAGRSFWVGAEPKSAVTPAIAELAQTITKGMTDRRSQAQAISDWVAGNVRYVAIFLGTGGFVPHDADSVALNRYGDCKDHTTLMRALLAAKGIAADYALINTRPLYRTEDVPRPNFDHVILYLPEFALYTDPTSANSGFGVLPTSLYDKPVLRSGTGGITLARTPVADAERNRLLIRAEITVAPDGTATGRSVTEGQGFMATVLRSLMVSMERQDTAELAKRNLNQQGLAGSGSLELRSPADRTEPYAVTSNFAVSDKVFAGGDARSVILGLRLVGRPIEAMRTINREGRGNDFVCIANSYREEIVLKLPEGRVPQQLPSDVMQRHALGEYSALYRRSGSTVTVTRQYQMRAPSSVCKVEVARQLAGVLDAADGDFRKIIRLVEPPAANAGKGGAGKGSTGKGG